MKEARIGQKRPDEKYGSLDIKAIYYMSILTTEGLKPTERYYNMKQKIVIFLMDYELFNLKETVVSSYICLNEDKECELTTLQKYYFVDLTKVKYLDDKNKRRLKLWLAFLNRDKEMLKMVKTDKILNKAEEEYEYLTGDEELKRLTELRNRAIRELKGSYYAGLEEGIEKGKIQIAKNMLNNKFSIDDIIKCTNLKREEIMALRTE